MKPAMKGPAGRVLSGVGIHSGIPCNLNMDLSDPSIGNREPRFLFPGHPEPVLISDLHALPRSSARSTILGSPGATIRTPEHLLAALIFFADLAVDIRCDASELPGLDGSALAFRDALSDLSPAHAAAPAWREYASELHWEHAWSYGHIRVRPGPRFRVSYRLDRPPLRQDFVLEHPAQLWNEILPARSFAFHREWREALGAGLMLGAGVDSGLLLAETEAEHAALLAHHPDWRGGPYPLLNQPSWRVDAELAKHKILDLIGDLALAGLALPRLDIEIRNGGHSLNHMLLDKLSLN